MSIVAFVLEVHRTLAAVSVPHAFGGALALAYLVDPRATVDVDLNVFVPLAEIDTVLGPLATPALRGPAMFPRVARLRRLLGG